jgi:hypothetical protein
MARPLHLKMLFSCTLLVLAFFFTCAVSKRLHTSVKEDKPGVKEYDSGPCDVSHLHYTDDSDCWSALQLQPHVRAHPKGHTFVPIPRSQLFDEWLSQSLPTIPVLSKKDDLRPLEFVLQQGLASASGLWLEFGVWRGASITLMAKHAGDGQHIYGFDSFVGLPEDFRASAPGDSSYLIKKDNFNMDGKLPKVPQNVALMKGWFNETLPGFLAERPGIPVSLLHIDSDLYSSAQFVLKSLRDRFHPGTVIVFDELVNYPSFREHEVLALFEFIRDGGWQAEWIGSKCPISANPENPKDVECCAVALRLT